VFQPKRPRIKTETTIYGVFIRFSAIIGIFALNKEAADFSQSTACETQNLGTQFQKLEY
jgi:hypothetical protein